MNITFARPAALFERKTFGFFADRWKFTTGNPRQSRKPRSSAPPSRRSKNRYCALARARASEPTRAAAQVQAVSSGGPLNRNGQPERRPILFPPSITAIARILIERKSRTRWRTSRRAALRSTSGPRKRALRCKCKRLADVCENERIFGGVR